jgi:2-succinyl-5-enolpyruvyl-6-hydroxy-3-cyclohexene-1-carboxylate synthase
MRVAEHPALKLWMHLDERCAAYFGLGLAKTLREPVALLATSGTAAANFLPAVVEASLARVPLVVLTADRPHELRDNGAAQTIDQLRLYGQHVKWFFDLPEPEAGDDQLRLVTILAGRAVATSMAEPAGPVHLNWPFREPLIPAPTRSPQVRRTLRVANGRLSPSPDLVDALARDLARVSRGVIVVGPQDDSDLAPSVARLAAALGYPVFADALSGVRRGPHDRSLVLDSYDAFLRAPTAVRGLEPDVVVRIGAMPTSKPLQQFIQVQTRARHIVVDPGGWREPTNLATDVFHVDPRPLCDALAGKLPQQGSQREWADRWVALNTAARRALDAHLVEEDDLFEGKIFVELSAVLPDGALVYAGNSMPVRDLDTFLPQSSRRLQCMSNRGANGIDGVVSSALGASAADRGPVVLVIGDLSFYHDLNGLLAARKHGLDLLVVLLNNDGGGIFSFLPQAESAGEHFELLFGTPHGLDFQPFVEGFSGRFVRVTDWASFSSAVTDALAVGGLNVIEVPTERQHNVRQHRAVWRSVAEALPVLPRQAERLSKLVPPLPVA